MSMYLFIMMLCLSILITIFSAVRWSFEEITVAVVRYKKKIFFKLDT